MSFNVEIELFEGRELPSKDKNGLSDPYVRFAVCEGTSLDEMMRSLSQNKHSSAGRKIKTHFKKKSSIQKETLNPKWGLHTSEHIKLGPVRIYDAPMLLIEAWDWDILSKDDFIGRYVVDLRCIRYGEELSCWHKLKGLKDVDAGELRLSVSVVPIRDTKSAYEFAKSLRSNCSKTGSKWEDPEFPAEKLSLKGGEHGRWGPDSVNMPSRRLDDADLDRIEWKRPSEIVKEGDVKLFVDGVEAGDVEQGSLGDCYLLGAAAVLATRKDLLLPLFFSDHMDHGFVQVRFWKDGRWQVVTIDDRLPVLKSGNGFRLIYGSCRDPTEFWVPLLEKAYAKLHGSYSAIESGDTGHALTDLTGEYAETFEGEQLKEDHFWDKTSNWLSDEVDWMMACSFSCDDSSMTESEIGSTGLLASHAYSVLKAYEHSTGLKLVQLRNPWGRKEWTGPYSDKSNLWTPELKACLDFKDEDDGTFWMPWPEFLKYFNRAVLLRLLTDKVGKRYHCHRFQGNWKGVSAGGCPNHPDTFTKNPQYGILFSQKKKGPLPLLKQRRSTQSIVYAILSQPDARMRLWQGQGNNYEHAIGLSLVKTEDATRPKVGPVQAEERTNEKGYVNLRDYLVELELEPEQPYVLVPSSFHPGVEMPFFLNIFSQHALSLIEPVTDYKRSELQGRWVGSTAGGCRNHSTWTANPCFLLKSTHPKHPLKDFFISLTQLAKENLLFVGFYAGVYNGKRPQSTSEIKWDYTCTNSPEISSHIEHNPETPKGESEKDKEISFWIMPVTFQPNQQAEFKLTIHAGHNSSLMAL